MEISRQKQQSEIISNSSTLR